MLQVLVQLGDILDRGENEIAILSLLRSMDKQAQEEGGAVFQVCIAENGSTFRHFSGTIHFIMF